MAYAAFFAGANFGIDDGRTSNHYGYNIPFKWVYYLDISFWGVNIDVAVFRDRKSVLAIHLPRDLERVSLGPQSALQ